jgi:integrase
LPKSHSHYQDFLDLRGDGRVVLYKRADHQNPKWTVRLKIPETSGFVVKSTKTTDDFEARRFAEDLYYRLEGKARRGEPINSPTFRRVFAEWSKLPVAEEVVRTARYVNGNVRRVDIWALQYFGELTIDKVTEAKLADYVDWRLSQPRRPAIVTLKNERTAIRQLLRFAKRRGYISDVPEFAIKSGKINARPDIPETEWHRLVRFLPGYVDRAQDKRRQRERFYLVLYILIMGNTGIRIGEARRLRWRDVSTNWTLTDEVRAILSVRGKTGEREVVCDRGVERYLDELRSFRTEESGHPPPDQEHLFCHPSGAPVGSFKGGSSEP